MGEIDAGCLIIELESVVAITLGFT